MIDNNTNQQSDNDSLAAFAGLVVLLAFLSILFALTTPGVMGDDNVSDQETVVEAEPTQVVEVVDEATEVPAEETEVTLVSNEEATEVPEVNVETDDTQGATVDTNTTSDYDPEIVAQGESLYITCAACHGPDGTGIEGLGKDLVNGEFVNSISDEDLVNFIVTGRPVWDVANTTMIDMPPRGGNPTLTNDDIFAIVAYLRTLGSEDSNEAHEDENTDVVGNSDAESIANGETLFVTCSACHGPDGTGIEGLGKDLVNGEFALTATDEELANVIINGRPVWDTANTTMIDMPPRGGNPTLTNDDIDDIIAYIRSLQSP